MRRPSSKVADLPLILAFSFAVIVAGCKKDDTAAAAATPSSATPATSASAISSAAPATSAAPLAAGDVEVGQPPPDFTATAQDGTAIHLAALKGKPVVVYFYPKDETAGCTKEACSFRDAWDALHAKGVVLIGVSGDTDDSHRAFTSNHKLPFLLVSDPKGDLAAKFGVPFHLGFAARQSFVIGADGNVKKIYRTVDVTVHSQQIEGDLSLNDRTLLVRIDGELLAEKGARDLWNRFSAYMEEHRGDLGGFAKQEGFSSIRPSFEDGAAILIASHSETQVPYRSVSAEPEPSKGGASGPKKSDDRSSRGSGKSQAGAKSRHKKR